MCTIASMMNELDLDNEKLKCTKNHLYFPFMLNIL
jgi:hypothetical protein